MVSAFRFRRVIPCHGFASTWRVTDFRESKAWAEFPERSAARFG